MAGRPQIWTPFARISWARDYQYTDDGRIRDKDRNVLPDRGPDCHVTLRVYGSERQVRFPKRDILAMEFFGEPPHHDCVICGEGPPYRVLHLNGDRRDWSRGNLKYVPDDKEARWHELQCCEMIMQRRPHDPRRRPTLDGRMSFADDKIFADHRSGSFSSRGCPFVRRTSDRTSVRTSHGFP